MRARSQTRAAFTVIELLIVMAIIIVLAGLILATSGYVQKKGARSRAETEIAAISAALENYKADNGVYPQSTATNALDPTAAPASNNSNYLDAGHTLYQLLSGDPDGAPGTTGDDTKNYISALLRAGSLATPSGQIPYLKDPFGNPYGYSTMKANDSTAHGYNPTFDLWSTVGITGASASDQAQWIKNW
jgi:type II secretory pathway pseudopilin PulG